MKRKRQQQVELKWAYHIPEHDDCHVYYYMYNLLLFYWKINLHSQ